MILQITLISLLAFLGSIGTPFFFGTTGGFYVLGRPLIASFLVGLITGDMDTALKVGIVIQSMYIGIVTPGAVLPFDVSLIGYIAPALIIMSNANANLAATLTVPIGLLGVMMWNFTYVANVYFVHRADKEADKGSIKGVIHNNLLPQVLNFILRFGITFAILFLGKGYLEKIVAFIPAWLNNILSAIGALLPALGIGLLLNMIVKNKLHIGLFIVGYILTVYLKLPIIAIAILGTVLALAIFESQKGNNSALDSVTNASNEGDISKTSGLLDSKTLNSTFWKWLFFNGCSQSGERMQGIGFAHAMTPVIEKLYGNDKDETREALKRHTMIFNVEPQIGSVVLGTVSALEEQRAQGGDIDDDTINTIKVALMGPLSGIGDTLIPGTLIPLMLAIAIALTQSAGVAGPIFYAVAYLLFTIFYSKLLFKFGYKTGVEGIQSIMSNGQLDGLTNALNVLGLLVIGSLSATYINVQTKLQYASGDMKIKLQSILDNIMPGLIGFVFVFFIYWLIAKKKFSALKIIGLIFLIGIVLGGLGVI
ncbi:PTS system mannose/fructose/sorbose family transporter subunit IID [Companilactobacillus formosensis]|jgi:mannose/fructose/N-acetylgalactosamine-specific phosphotransferase system component IID/mannose/fructose/N-acetylgalactosamine-specific phosphotransferase system component IIC|uniref:PTS system mannose/fructose/sorbose family transporter subunit IID n=1 Tax=Companilactobacillus formosensis TaxID=1617889 RepID=UPI00210022D6|nr:PTS system mannose/fructose/sorbose family transporter subunit IID [Companilactobacillus formosensis]